MIRTALCLIFLSLPQWVQALTCSDQTHEGRSLTICTVDATLDNLRLFLRGDDGAILGQFRDIERTLEEGKILSFGMNAGMYHADRSPVGHYVEDGTEEMRILTGGSKGNFGLLPNGVLCLNDGSVRVYETLDFQKQAPNCRDATQSGPMLVIDGDLHPRFLPNSTSRFLRNGVGTTNDGKTAYFVISNEAVTFHEFGRFFRDKLQTPNALYFDGKISRLHAPQLNRSDGGFWMGPIIGVVESDSSVTE